MFLALIRAAASPEYNKAMRHLGAPILLVIIITHCPGFAWGGNVKRSDVQFTQHETSIDVTLDGRPFTTYHFATGDDAQFARPYLYPVLAADGTPLTSDQAKGGDHPHHRSFYVAHGDVNGADHWSLMLGAKQPRQRHVKFDKVDGDTIVERLEWESADRASVLLNETRTLRFFTFNDHAAGGSRGVDLTIALTPASETPVTLGDTKEAGLCSVRVVPSISDDATLINSAGQGGKGKKGEEATWGKAAAWCDISGTIDGKAYGIAMLDHPTNPRHPTRWHVRQYGLLSANMWGLSAFDKAAPGTGAMTLKPGTTTTFRYRVVFHPGDAKSADLPEKFEAFAKE
jgi:hypothetical protein